MEPRQIFVHVHVPKCGGTTFQQILYRNFGPGFSRDGGLLEDYQYNAGQFKKIMQAHPWLECYSSHKISLNLPFELAGVSIRAITFVRDPVERFISHYFYHRNSPTNYNPIAKQLDLDSYIDYALAQEHQKMYVNGQTRFLTGWGDETGLHHIRQRVKQGHVLLFPLDRFDESCVLLERIYPGYFKNCAYVRRNRSLPDQAVTAAARQRIGQYAPLDFELLQLAQEGLTDLCGLNFSTETELEQALTNFYRRCRRQERRAKIYQGLIRPAIALVRRFLKSSGIVAIY